MKVTVVIPVVQAQPRLQTLVAGLAAKGCGSIVLSVEASLFARGDQILETLVGDYGCALVSFTKETGRGGALKAAFRRYLTQMPEDKGIVTAETDGAGAAADLLCCAAALERDPDTLVLAARDMQSETVPSHARQLNDQILSVINRGGGGITDALSGVRGMPRKLVQSVVELPYNGQKFEACVLLAAQKEKITVEEIHQQPAGAEPAERAEPAQRAEPAETAEIFDAAQVLPGGREVSLAGAPKAPRGAAPQQPAPARPKCHPVGRFFAVLGVLLAAVLTLFFGAATIVCYGPSTAARDLYVSTVMETSAAKFLARLYFPQDQIDAILAANTTRATDEVSNSAGVTLPTESSGFDLNAITVEDVKGSTFVGKLMTVNDPSRMFVQTVQTFDTYGEGELLKSMVARTGAVAGINGGGFYDPNGNGKGGMPLGVVIQHGKITSNMDTKYSTIIGFDADHKLVVGDMSAQQAVDRGVQEAVSFGPALVINGERAAISGTGGGLNPRTAIGQRADGAVLLLVIDGRQPHSLGASYKDVADIMLQHGAVNAANLDGGSSSMLIYNGEMLNSLSSLVGERAIPTAFLVGPPNGAATPEQGAQQTVGG